MKKRVLLWLSPLPLVAYALWAAFGPPGYNASTRLRAGDWRLWAIARPDRVEVLRVRLPIETQGGGAVIGAMQVLERGKSLKSTSLEQLQYVLGKSFTSATVAPGVAVTKSLGSQLPMPDVAFRFHRGATQVDVCVAFHCNIADLADAPEYQLPPILRADFARFDSWRAELAMLAKEAFPHDPEIQALKERLRGT